MQFPLQRDRAGKHEDQGVKKKIFAGNRRVCPEEIALPPLYLLGLCKKDAPGQTV
jgi:hypothetical protein